MGASIFNGAAPGLFGAAVGLRKTDNFGSLEKKEFKLEASYTLDNQKLKTEKEITAYKGTHKTLSVFEINGDIVHFTEFEQDNTVAWNVLYLRGTRYKDSDIPYTANLGTGAYFFNKSGKFLGGVYGEVADVTNKKNSEDDLFNRLTLGIVAKFAFNPIFSPHQK